MKDTKKIKLEFEVELDTDEHEFIEELGLLIYSGVKPKHNVLNKTLNITRCRKWFQ